MGPMTGSARAASASSIHLLSTLMSMLSAEMGRAARRPMPPAGDTKASTLSRYVTLSGALSLRCGPGGDDTMGTRTQGKWCIC